MNAAQYILKKQQSWARNHGIELISSHGDRGRKAYTRSLDQNLFQPLTTEARRDFSRGDGNEINGKPDRPAKMQAVHSSSAIGVNLFHYWQSIDQVPAIAAACGFCRKGNGVSQKIVFEDKYSISPKFQFSPNIDAVFHNTRNAKYKRFAVE
jgi:hypothetical protein